ncbi:MAG: hypothetical protein ACYDDF_05725 [Thermoplasmatota archaeon]
MRLQIRSWAIALAGVLCLLVVAPMLAPVQADTPVSVSNPSNAQSPDQCAQMNAIDGNGNGVSAPRCSEITATSVGEVYVYVLAGNTCMPQPIGPQPTQVGDGPTLGIYEENGKEPGLQTGGQYMDNILFANCWPWGGS